MKLKQRGIILLAFLFVFCIYKLYEAHSGSNVDFLNKRTPTADKVVPINHLDVPAANKGAQNKFPNFTQLAEEDHRSKSLDIEAELNRLRLDMQGAQVENLKKYYEIAADWVEERQIYPYVHSELASILKIMSTAKIIQADTLPRGTQIKLLLVLDGGQKVVFKQKRYERDHVIKGKPYDGYDRHNAEIAAFHLDRLLDFRRSPLVVGRRVNLKEDIMPVATERLLKTFREKDGNTCYFGVCLYCNEKNMACADGEMMEGAVTLWLPEKWSHFEKQRHPYQRTYRDGYVARWENDETYCNAVVKKKPPYDKGPRLLDITDGTVFDYLIGNADRHHYEIFKNHGPDVMLLMMDNAKSFGNPNHHEPSILAPLRQCCLLRNSTWVKIQQLQGGVLTQLLEAAMENDPIAPVLHPSHLNAMDARLLTLMDTTFECISKHGYKNVIVNQWNGL